jgi:hypothetical protein|tara:strand:- start:130 stop:321 length:192 start_codon:yes stop_codon:yes gene_type:complete
MDECKVRILSYLRFRVIQITVFKGWQLSGNSAEILLSIHRGKLTYLSNYGKIGASKEAFYKSL